MAPDGPLVPVGMGVEKVPAGQLEPEGIADRAACKLCRDGPGWATGSLQGEGRVWRQVVTAAEQY